MADLITPLPLEVLQHIASHCSLRGIFALDRTCRRFHAACSGTFVFQQCFVNHMQNPRSHDVRDKEMVSRLITKILSTKSPYEARLAWATLAAAASELPATLHELEDMLHVYESVPWEYVGKPTLPSHLSPTARNIISMLSTWTVLCSPTVNDFPLTASLTGLAASMLNPDIWRTWHPTTWLPLASKVAFCLAMGGLTNPALNNMPLLAFRVASLSEPAWDELEDSPEGVQTRGFLTVACLPWILRSDMRISTRENLPHPASLPLLRQSVSEDIPFPDGSHLSKFQRFGWKHIDLSPIGASLNMFGAAPSWTRWLCSNPPALVDDITRGVWVGYVSTSQGRYSEIPPPAQNMQFTSEPDPEDPDRIEVASETGEDARGSFRLRGDVIRSTGSVRLEKRWASLGNGVVHVFHAALTPLGIAGYWAYNSDPHDFMGFVWIYREEWVPKSSCRGSPNPASELPRSLEDEA
ncbi:hypothetical protein QBC47DRAFT_386879 [Echria macrotheca]|uniref:F-box domain-containing protein n=1 Tax=Echria macrotheca TaxID=438768 RepID=A0AAJ0FA01_9PEZI|nr:hypothetical protein QBC47DRAFT_386879 [Echria macrotheca]